MNPIAGFTCPAAILLLAGCLETEDEYTINLDGSGKVIRRLVFQPLDIEKIMGGKPKDQQMKRAVQAELEKAEGVDAWKDVSFEPRSDGRILFKGTAYFKEP